MSWSSNFIRLSPLLFKSSLSLPLHLFILLPSIMDFSQFSTILILTVILTIFAAVSGSRDLPGDYIRLPSQSQASRFFHEPENDDHDQGTRWAILLAGSNGYWNYRHQVHMILFVYIYLYINFSFWEDLYVNRY